MTDSHEPIANTPIPHEITSGILFDMTAGQTEELLGNETEREPFEITGQRRILSRDNRSLLSVATYDETAGDHMTEMLSDDLGLKIESVIGHVEFNFSAGNSSVDGGLYVARNGVFARVSAQVDPADLQTQDAQDCFSAAQDLGIGDLWTLGLLDYFRGENTGSWQNTVQMSDPSVAHLNAALQRIEKG